MAGAFVPMPPQPQREEEKVTLPVEVMLDKDVYFDNETITYACFPPACSGDFHPRHKFGWPHVDHDSHIARSRLGIQGCADVCG